MNIADLAAYDNILVQSGPEQKELAKVLGFSPDFDKVIVRLSDNRVVEMDPQYILKNFGR